MPKLTARQQKAIPFIVSSPTYTEGIKRAKISRKTLSEWLKQPEFKAELDSQRKAVTVESFGILSQSLTKAVEVLVGLLDTKDQRLKRLVCRDIIEHFLNYKQNNELEKRLTAIEQRLNEQSK